LRSRITDLEKENLHLKQKIATNSRSFASLKDSLIDSVNRLLARVSLRPAEEMDADLKFDDDEPLKFMDQLDKQLKK